MYAISYVVLHLGIIKPMNLKLTASCLATTGEDKEIFFVRYIANTFI